MTTEEWKEMEGCRSSRIAGDVVVWRANALHGGTWAVCPEPQPRSASWAFAALDFDPTPAEARAAVAMSRTEGKVIPDRVLFREQVQEHMRSDYPQWLRDQLQEHMRSDYPQWLRDQLPTGSGAWPERYRVVFPQSPTWGYYLRAHLGRVADEPSHCARCPQPLSAVTMHTIGGDQVCSDCYSVEMAKPTEHVQPDEPRDPGRGEAEVQRLTRERDSWRSEFLAERMRANNMFRKGESAAMRVWKVEEKNERRDAALRAVFGTSGLEGW